MSNMIHQSIRKMPNAFTRDEILCTFKYTFWGHSGTSPKFFLDIQSTFKKSWLPYSIRKWVSNLIKNMYQDKQSQFCRLSLEFDKKFDKYSHDLDTCLLIKIVLYSTAVCCIHIFYQSFGLFKKDLKSNIYGKFWD